MRNIQAIEERYLHDPYVHGMVEAMTWYLRNGGSGQELRQASHLALRMHERAQLERLVELWPGF